MFRSSSKALSSPCWRCASRQYSTPHPSLTLVPDFLSRPEQSLLLSHSLALLDSPARTTSAGRKKRKTWLKSNPSYRVDEVGFMHDDAYEFEQGHFDGVIRGYREMLVRPGHFDATTTQDETRRTELERVLAKVYTLLPPSSSPSSSSVVASERPSPPPRTAISPLDPPEHLIMHLLHLSSTGRIFPHVDNLEAFGRTIVGVSLGGSERVMRFKQTSEPSDPLLEGPREFEVLVPSGSAYIQQEPLRTHYTHEILDEAVWEGRTVGGSQRLSIMLRDRLPIDDTKQ